LYIARRLLKGFSTKDLGYVREDNIFITERLTSKNKELFKEVYKAKKEKYFKFIWTASGPIFLRRNETSPVLKVNSISDVQKVK
jgi:hypothetical protein